MLKNSLINVIYGTINYTYLFHIAAKTITVH